MKDQMGSSADLSESVADPIFFFRYFFANDIQEKKHDVDEFWIVFYRALTIYSH